MSTLTHLLTGSIAKKRKPSVDIDTSGPARGYLYIVQCEFCDVCETYTAAEETLTPQHYTATTALLEQQSGTAWSTSGDTLCSLNGILVAYFLQHECVCNDGTAEMLRTTLDFETLDEKPLPNDSEEELDVKTVDVLVPVLVFLETEWDNLLE